MFFSSSAFTDERLMDAADLIGDKALIWPWLIPYLDDWGRGSGNPRVIKATCFPSLPISVEDVADALDAFVKVGLLECYADSRGRPVIAADEDAWWAYQTHIHSTKRDDDSKSRFPAPSGIPRDSAETRASLRHATPHHTSKAEPTYQQLLKTAEVIVDERIADGYPVENREAFARSIARSEEARHRWFKEQPAVSGFDVKEMP